MQAVSEKNYNHLEPKIIAQFVSRYNKSDSRLTLGMSRLGTNEGSERVLAGTALREAFVKSIRDGDFDEELLKESLESGFDNGAVLNVTGQKNYHYKIKIDALAQAGGLPTLRNAGPSSRAPIPAMEYRE